MVIPLRLTAAQPNDAGFVPSRVCVCGETFQSRKCFKHARVVNTQAFPFREYIKRALELLQAFPSRDSFKLALVVNTQDFHLEIASSLRL